MKAEFRFGTVTVNQKGNALIVVLIVVLLITLIATFLYKSSRSHRKQVQAQTNYSVASDRADATIVLAKIWLDSLNDPPELDADWVTDCTNCYKQITNKSEEELSKLSADQFYKIDENGDGEINSSDAAQYLIVPLGISAASNCISNDGYSNSCWRRHTYVIVARTQTGINTQVERKQQFSRSFYY
ncbi:hypothetical protein L0156_15270 [bacterium]|nr:hypothetical protein [bacterium]